MVHNTERVPFQQQSQAPMSAQKRKNIRHAQMQLNYMSMTVKAQGHPTAYGHKKFHRK